MKKQLENSLLFIWLVSLVATLGSLYFSEVRGYIPCELCWYQRILMYPIFLMTTVAYIQKNAKIAATTAVFSIIGGSMSLYHYGIQKIGFLSANAPSCGQVPCTGQYINWFGFITIPFLALIAFILIAITSFYMLKVLKGKNNLKKLGIIAAIVVVLFATIIILTNISNQSKLENNPYGTTDLRQSTIDLLDNENYQNVIQPEALQEKIASGEPVVAYMFSPECVHCQNFTPNLMPAASEVGVHIDQLNILEYQAGWAEYGISSTPTLIYFNEGKEVQRIAGDYSNEMDKVVAFLENAKK